MTDDLHEASALARQMITAHGMSPLIGSAAVGDTNRQVFLGALGALLAPVHAADREQVLLKGAGDDLPGM